MFTARYELVLQINSLHFVFNGLTTPRKYFNYTATAFLQIRSLIFSLQAKCVQEVAPVCALKAYRWNKDIDTHIVNLGARRM